MEHGLALFSHLSLRATPEVGAIICFTGEAIKAQRGSVTCQRSHSQCEPGFELRFPASQLIALSTDLNRGNVIITVVFFLKSTHDAPEVRETEST